MNHSLPKHRDDAGDLSRCCTPRPGGAKELHNYHRTLPSRPNSDSVLDVLLDEAGIPILDEQSGATIFDDLRRQ